MTAALVKPSWQDVAKAKVAARDALIPPEWRIKSTDELNVMDVPRTCGLLSDEEIDITESDAVTLVKKILAGELSSYNVTLAFCKRAAIAQQLTNCLTEIFFEQALREAKAVDEEYAKTKQSRGLLHGLPVSLKDCLNVRGVDTTVGFIAWASDPAEQETEMTKIMRECGAILYCKTNVPAAMMYAESYNNVWGYTCNPYNRSLSSGGSTGGESALLALKGSPLGVGTDIGGSIRLPASFCGLYSIKPSFGRFATYGSRSGLPGQEAVRSINGPMSTSLEAIELWAQAVVGKEPWTRDPNMIPIPWREVTLAPKLCFGLVLDNGMVKPTPPVTRALMETKAALEAAGHKVVEWTPLNSPLSAQLLTRFFEGDGGIKIASVIAAGGEPWPEGLSAYKAAYEASKNTPPLVGDLWTTATERVTYAKQALDYWMGSKELTGTGRPFDGLISPTHAGTAPRRYEFNWHIVYTSMWNILDQSCTTIPVTTVKPEDVKVDVPTPFRTHHEQLLWEKYDPVELAGSPVTLQIVCQRLEEEKAVALTKIVRDALFKYRAK